MEFTCAIDAGGVDIFRWDGMNELAHQEYPEWIEAKRQDERKEGVIPLQHHHQLVNRDHGDVEGDHHQARIARKARSAFKVVLCKYIPAMLLVSKASGFRNQTMMLLNKNSQITTSRFVRPTSCRVNGLGPR
jgi:hypothetical protein